MSLFKLPNDLLEVVCGYIGSPVTYFRLRGTCRAGVAALKPELTLCMDCLEQLQDWYYRVQEPQFDCKFRLSDPLSDDSAIRVMMHTDHQVVEFFKNFSVDEIRANLSIRVIEECIETLSEIKDYEGCEKLIASVENTSDFSDPFIRSRLFVEDFGIVDMMVKRGLVLKANPSRGSLLVTVVSNGGTLKTVKYLLSHGVSLDEVNLEELLFGMAHVNREVASLVLRKHKDRDIVRTSDDFTLDAVSEDDLGLVKQLIQCGAPIDPNECISEAISIPMIRYLVQQHGADINYVNDMGGSALRNLCETCDGAARIPELMKLGLGMSPEVAYDALFGALHSDDPIRVFKRLFKLGIDVNTIDPETQFSVLHEAIGEPYMEEEVAFLIKSKADIHAPGGDEGSTPLMLAALAPSAPIVDMLLKHGARTDDVDIEGRDVYHYGESAGDLGVLYVLLQHSGKLGGRKHPNTNKNRKNTIKRKNQKKAPVVRPHCRGE